MAWSKTRRPERTHVDAEGHMYDVGALFEASRYLSPVTIELDVTQVLDGDVWSNGRETGQVRLRNYLEPILRVMDADTRYPILVRVTSVGNYEIIDGNHRVMRAIIDGSMHDGDKVTMRAIVVTEEQLLSVRVE